MKITSQDVQRSFILGATVGLVVFAIVIASQYLFPSIPQEVIMFVGVVAGPVLGGLVASNLKKK